MDDDNDDVDLPAPKETQPNKAIGKYSQLNNSKGTSS